MNWRIIAAGKPSLTWAKAGIEDYERRLIRMARLEIVYLKESPAATLGERSLEASAGCRRVAMDERGRLMDTAEFVTLVDRWEMEGVKRVALIIGGSHGHTPATRAAVDDTWAMGRLTLQHELALVVLLEQIYRVHTIKRGEPYHR